MKCNNFFRGLVLCLTLLVVNTIAQDYVAVAHVVYNNGSSLYYADNEENFKYQPISLDSDGTFTIRFKEERLKASKIQERKLRFGLGCKENTSTCETYLSKDEPTLSQLFPDYVEGDKKQPIYEVWVVIEEDSTVSYDTKKPTDKILAPVEKTIRFLAPWSNTGVLMYSNGEEKKMAPLRDSLYCGWFESKIIARPPDVFVYFKQSIGEDYVGAEGLYKEPVSIEQELRLDSVFSISGKDTIWILATTYSAPELYTEFPDETGECPVKKIPIMMFDWLHGDGNDNENRTAQANTTSQDFGTGGCKKNDGQSITEGMVEAELGPNGVPVAASPLPKGCEYTDHLNNWFIPEVVAKDAAGNSYTNATCRELELTLDDDGFWLGQKNKDSPEKGLFFLDDFEYLDSAQTVPNPMYDQITSDYGTHNYGFTMAVQAQFEYVKGQKFEFEGDDDVWVFINNKLVVDIGGQHVAKQGKVNLDDLGLTEGETYPFRIFYAERHKNQSNFKMYTSMDLKAEASMLLMDRSPDAKTIVKEVWEKVRKQALSCDFLSSATDTTLELGPSNFVLFGKSLGKKGVALKTLDSLYYSGITVSNDFTMVTVDTKAIGKAQALPPGNYYIRVRLKSNPDEYKDVPFTIEPYELPNLAFASIKDSSYFIVNFEDPENPDTSFFDQFWGPFGDSLSRNVVSDTLPISLQKGETMWAGRSYPVNIMYVEDWASVYSGVAVQIKTSTPNLVVCDSVGNPIDEVVLMNGRAIFFVKATDEVVDGVLTASSFGAKNKEIQWTKINIKVPPVPQIKVASIYDNTGDGRADFISIEFNKPLGGQSVLDSLRFTFGPEKFNSSYKAEYKDGDLVATVTAKGDGFGSSIFTGGVAEPYVGKIDTVWYTYTDDEGKKLPFWVDGPLADKVGPVVLSAEVKYLKDGNTQLTVSFSEGIDDAEKSSDLFRFHCWKNNVQDSAVKMSTDIAVEQVNQWKLIFPKGLDTDVIPAVGDSIRFRPPSQLGEAVDLLGVSPHEANPWVRITGEQKVTITSPKVVSLAKDSPSFEYAREIVRSEDATVPKLVSADMSADSVGRMYGTQGHFLGDLDMAQLVENEIAEIVKAVQGTPTYVDKDEAEAAEENGTTPRTYTIQDIIREVDEGRMTISEAEDRFGLDAVIVDAYENGLLDSKNVDYYARGTEADIKKIVSAVADETELRYETHYYTSLGHYVSGDSRTITCNDDIFKENGAKNCLDNDGRLFLAWNMRSDAGNLVATGVYIARLQIRIKVNTKKITDRTQDFLWGVRRGTVNAKDFGL